MAPDTCKTLTTIRNSGARLLNLINDILDAAALRKVGRVGRGWVWRVGQCVQKTGQRCPALQWW